MRTFGGSLHACLFRCCRDFIKHAPLRSDRFLRRMARFYEGQPERGPGPELGDYLGLPINAAVRLRADTRSASLITLPEWQCRPHPATISGRGPSNLTITKEIDPVSPRDHRLSHGMSAIQGPPRLPR